MTRAGAFISGEAQFDPLNEGHVEQYTRNLGYKESGILNYLQ